MTAFRLWKMLESRLIERAVLSSILVLALMPNGDKIPVSARFDADGSLLIELEPE